MPDRVLIVDDDAKVRDWLVARINAAGYRALGIGSGAKAVEILAKSPPEALVLDLHLPDVSGIDVLKALRGTESGRDMPVIVVTGVYKGVEHAMNARRAFRIDSYIEKPFKLESLLEALKKAIDLHRLRMDMRKASPKPPPETAAPPIPDPAPPPPKTKESIEGDLKQTPFDQLLLKLWTEHATGILRVSSKDVEGKPIERAFALMSGKPVLGRSKLDNEDFGTHLLREGVITPEENREFQYLVSRGTRDSEDIFIKMGCLTPDTFNIQRVRHLEELVIHCFALADGTFKFIESEMEIGAATGALVPRIIHEGYGRHLSEQRLGALYQQAVAGYLCRAPSFYDYLEMLDMDAEEIAFAEKIDGLKMLKDHLDGPHFHKILKLYAALSALGMVKISPTPNPAKVAPPFPKRKPAPPPAPPIQTQPKAAPAQPHKTAATAKAEALAPQFVMEQPAPAKAEGFEDLGEALSDELGDLAGELDFDLDAAPESLQPPKVDDTANKLAKEREDLKKKLVAENDKIKNGNYYDYFDMKINRFKFDEMKKAYFEKRKMYSPENFIEWADGRTISLAENVFTQLTSAYNTLSNVVSKEKYDELIESTAPKISGDSKADRFQAQVQFESGKAFVEMAEWDSAIQALREAMDLYGNEGAYHAWLGWAMFNKDKLNAANVKRAKDELNASLKLDPRLAIAFAFRGSILLEEGNLDQAEVELKRALKFNPQSKHARRELRVLEERRESQKKGLFGRIFS